MKWCHSRIPWGINPNFSGLSPSTRQIAYALRTRAPVSMEQAPSTPRLACVKPAASVHPEPGSNSSSYNLKILRPSDSRWLWFPSNVFNLSLLCFPDSRKNQSAVYPICLWTYLVKFKDWMIKRFKDSTPCFALTALPFQSGCKSTTCFDFRKDFFKKNSNFFLLSSLPVLFV
jgi:hypothetical protein